VNCHLKVRATAFRRGVAIRDDYKWLPATAANLSLLTPAGAIPAGLTQVPDAAAGN